eukprot:403340605
MTRNDNLRSSLMNQSNSIKQLPPQHPGNLSNTNLNQNSNSQQNLQMQDQKQNQQQKKLKFINQNLKANGLLQSISTGQLQKSMSEFIKKSNEKPHSTTQQNQQFKQKIHNTTTLSNSQSQQLKISSKLQQQIGQYSQNAKNQLFQAKLNNSLEELPDLNNSLQKSHLQRSDNFDFSTRIQAKNQTMNLNERLRNMSLESDTIQLDSARDNQFKNTSNLQLNTNSVSKKLDINKMLNKNFQLPPKLNQNQSVTTISGAYEAHKTPTKKLINQFIPQSEKQLLPLVTRITPLNKQKIAEISQQIASFTSNISGIGKQLKLNLNQSSSTGKLKLAQVKKTFEDAVMKQDPHIQKKDSQGLEGTVLNQFKSTTNKNQIKIKKNLVTNMGQGGNNSINNPNTSLMDLSKSKNTEASLSKILLSTTKNDITNNLDTQQMMLKTSQSIYPRVPAVMGNQEKQRITDNSLSPPRLLNLHNSSIDANNNTTQPTQTNQFSRENNPTQMTNNSPSLFDLKNLKSESSKLGTSSQESIDLPISGSQALSMFKQHLSKFEQEEILQFPEVYFVNTQTTTDQAELFLAQSANNNGFDDDQNYYRHRINEHIMYRFEVLERLGRGSFGQVYKCYDHKQREEMALKVIRNKQKFHKQALVELKILDHLRRFDEDDRKHVVKMKEAFLFRNHLCITFEMLNINLYQMIKACKFKGFDVKVVKNMALHALWS